MAHAAAMALGHYAEVVGMTMAKIYLDVVKAFPRLCRCLTVDEPQSDERRRVIAAAKNVISRSAQFISEKGVQSHGGIGMTWEYNFAHYAKRLVMINHQLGDDDFHLERFAALLK